MDSAVRTQPKPSEKNNQLNKISRMIHIVADVTRADILVCVPRGAEQAEIIAHAQPHSIAPVHRNSMMGTLLSRDDAPALFRAMSERQYARALREFNRHEVGNGEGMPAPLMQEAYAIENETGQVIGSLLIETNLLESERLRRRSEVFQRTLKALHQMILRGELVSAADLAPFGEYDGIIITDPDHVIRYMSSIATNLYRNVGYGETLIGRPLEYLETDDEVIVAKAIKSNQCVQTEIEELGRTWIKKVIPIRRTERGSIFSSSRSHFAAVMILLHDDTEARQRARELEIKATMIKELHHRVKNDLQTVASLLRMQSRRLQTPEAKSALGEAVNRILSIAVIHEFLSEQSLRVINIRDVAQRIVQQMQAGILDPSRRISFTLQGPNIYMPARQATSCALVVNELLQNALEHGYDVNAIGGAISVTFEDYGDAIGLIVHDDGRELPTEFSLDKTDSLGLKIVQTLVTQDLKGQIQFQSDHGVSVVVRFPKISLGGEEWNNEQE